MGLTAPVIVLGFTAPPPHTPWRAERLRSRGPASRWSSLPAFRSLRHELGDQRDPLSVLATALWPSTSAGELAHKAHGIIAFASPGADWLNGTAFRAAHPHWLWRSILAACPIRAFVRPAQACL